MTLDAATVSPGMGQCAITGKVVPEDELVLINGQRVCAEGKAILLDRLRSGEALPGELEKPTVLRRFGCIFLDTIILGVPFAILNGVLGAAKPGAFVILGTVSLLSAVVPIVYFGAMHAARGQTVGKIAGKLKVVNNLDGSPITAKTAWIRSLAYLGPGLLSGLAMMTANLPIMAGARMIVGAYGLTNVIFALVDTSRQRALHDRIAGTRVVEIR